MRKGWAVLGWALGALTVACARTEVRSVTLQVPDMADPRAVRIVTNAALNEVVGSYDGIQHDCEIDLSRGLVLYHQDERLLDPQFRRQIVVRLHEVGLNATIREVRLNPPPLTPTRQGLVQIWPGRHTAFIEVEGLRSATTANVVVDAIACARTGDHPNVVADAGARSLQVTYDTRQLGRQNLTTAIACSGHAVDDVPARLGQPDAPPLKWRPIVL